MEWFDWLASWAESVEFGIAMILLLLGIECLWLARRSYLNSRNELDDEALLGAEFGVFSAPSAHVSAAPSVPRSCYALTTIGASAILVSVVLVALPIT